MTKNKRSKQKKKKQDSGVEFDKLAQRFMNNYRRFILNLPRRDDLNSVSIF